MCLGKCLVLGEGFFAVAHAMRFEVGLSGEVDTILVAEVVPTGIVGIVAGTYGIDIELLHDLDVLNHALHGYDVTTIGIELMTIGTLDEDGLAVNEQLASLDFDMAEADLLANGLEGLTTLLQLKL